MFSSCLEMVFKVRVRGSKGITKLYIFAFRPQPQFQCVAKNAVAATILWYILVIRIYFSRTLQLIS